MSAPTDQADNHVPVDQDFSFLRAQPSELRRGMLERARSGDFLVNFHDRTPEERRKVAEWQENMATFLEVMEERDHEARRVQLVLALVRDLLAHGPIHPPLRRLAREYTYALREATSFEGPVDSADPSVVRALWIQGSSRPLRFPSGPAHLLSLLDYGRLRAAGRVRNPWATSDDDVPHLIPVPESSSEEAPSNPELAHLVVRRNLLDHFATRIVELDAAAVNATTATALNANTPTAVNGVTPAVANMNDAVSASNSAPRGNDPGAGRTGRRRHGCVEIPDEETA